MHAQRCDFLPISRQDMLERGWYYYDFLLVTGDAYVDHPSFGTAVISRVLEKNGFRVAVLSQPDFHTTADFEAMGRPRLGVLVNAGNIDSMVAHYSVARRRREKDAYTPGGQPGRRPDRAVIVYSGLARRAFPGLPVIIGGIEASLRRFAHYDYWEDKVRRSVLADSGADLLVYGMGEKPVVEIAKRLKKGERIGDIRDVRGTCFMAASEADCLFADPVRLPSFTEVSQNKKSYARAAFAEQNEQDFVRGHALLQPHEGRVLVQNPPVHPLEGRELDAVFDLPYTRWYHPDYEEMGGVAAIEEVQFSIIHNRGCFGSCNFCALALHQGRYVTSRGHDSVLREAEKMLKNPDFKGYIHDVGGPTANFRRPACKKQAAVGTCADRQCLFPTPCPALDAGESDYLALLRKLRALPGVKKVFIRSGIRFDYMLRDKKGEFFSELVQYHVGGQLKVAPEHISPNVLHYMGKPFADVYDRFCERFYKITAECGKEQYLVPYLMSSHPGSRLEDAIALAQYLKKHRMSPEQVQDFYPTPGTLSTAMYYTGLDPRTMKPVFVARTPEEKAMQRALLQCRNPKNRDLVLRALVLAGREDLIGGGPDCLIRGPVPENIRALCPDCAKKSEGKSRKPARGGPKGAEPAARGREKGRPAGKARAAHTPKGQGPERAAHGAKGGGRAKGGFGKKAPRRGKRP